MDDRKIELQVKESSRMVPFVALKVYEFPHINILWIGIIIMVVGIIMSMLRRIKLLKKLNIEILYTRHGQTVALEPHAALEKNEDI